MKAFYEVGAQHAAEGTEDIMTSPVTEEEVVLVGGG
jgi:hypothetical protein